MTVVARNTRAVTLPLTDANGSLSSIGGGAGAEGTDNPAAFFYATVGCMYRKITATAAGGAGFWQTPASGANDMTTAAKKVFMAKFAVTDFGGLNTTEGVSLRIGSSSGDYYNIPVTGSDVAGTPLDNYPAKGGFIVLPVDPNVAAYRRSTTGVPNLALVTDFGITARFATASAKAENLGLSCIDLGEGLDIHGLSVLLSDMVTFDEGTLNNRFGYATQLAPNTYNAFGTLRAGSNQGIPTATTITDSTIETWQHGDGLFDAGWSGWDFDLQSSGTALDISNKTFQSIGTTSVIDTRAVFKVTGNVGTLNFHDNIVINYASITLTSGVTFSNNSIISSEAILQAGATISNNSFSSAPTLSNEYLVDSSDVETVTGNSFTSGGTGHAVRITSLGDGGLTWNNTLSGYDAGVTGSPITPTATGNEALFIDVASGTVTITVADGATIPSIKSSGATVNVVANQIKLEVTVVDDSTGSPINDAHVIILRKSDKLELLNDTTGTDNLGTATVFMDYDVDTQIVGWARQMDIAGVDYEAADFSGQYTSSGFSTTVRLKPISI